MPQALVALHLLAHVAQGVFSATAVEFVDGHQIGEVEHVDLFQLGGRAELAGHHIQAQVHVIHHGGVALADARRLHDDQVKSGGGGHLGHAVKAPADLQAAAPGGQGAQVDAVGLKAI